MSFNKSFCVFFLLLFVSSGLIAQESKTYLTEPSLSPDKKEIAFVSGGDIWTVNANGGTANLLVSHPAEENQPRYSPDGKYLAFESDRTGNGDIYLLELTTNRLIRLTANDGSDVLDGWSYDGNWLYFNSSSLDIAGMRDVFRVNRNGGTPQLVTSDRYVNEFNAAPSRSGETLAFTARGISNSQWWRNGRSHIDESEIWLRTGAEYKQLAPRGAKQGWPMWNANSSSLFFVSDRSGHQNIHTLTLSGKRFAAHELQERTGALAENFVGRFADSFRERLWNLEVRCRQQESRPGQHRFAWLVGSAGRPQKQMSRLKSASSRFRPMARKSSLWRTVRSLPAPRVTAVKVSGLRKPRRRNRLRRGQATARDRLCFRTQWPARTLCL